MNIEDKTCGVCGLHVCNCERAVSFTDIPPKKRTILPPKDGWKEKTYYAVLVSVGPNNPKWVAIFHSGFLNGPNGEPGGYAKVWSATSDEHPYHTLHYLEALHELNVQTDFIPRPVESPPEVMDISEAIPTPGDSSGSFLNPHYCPRKPRSEKPIYSEVVKREDGRFLVEVFKGWSAGGHRKAEVWVNDQLRGRWYVRTDASEARIGYFECRSRSAHVSLNTFIGDCLDPTFSGPFIGQEHPDP